MAWSDFAFNPPTGLEDTDIYPTTPASEADFRADIQEPMNQIKTHINGTLKNYVATSFTDGGSEISSMNFGGGMKGFFGKVTVPAGTTAKLSYPVNYFGTNTTVPMICSNVPGGDSGTYSNTDQITVNGYDLTGATIYNWGAKPAIVYVHVFGY